MKPRKIVYLAANPVDTDQLALDQEYRAIDQEFERAEYRRRFELVQSWGTAPSDLMHVLRRHKPTVVQFSGHGYRAGARPLDHGVPHRDVVIAPGPSIEQGLCFQGPGGRLQVVPDAALKDAFGVAGASVKLIILAACFTKQLAASLLEHVESVVGMDGAIGDDAARHFVVGLYAGIGAGASLEEAFRQGRAAIGMEGLQHGDRPQLMVRDGVDASQLILAKDPRNRSPRRRR